jgi:pyruvate formate lyase activating enzyme
MAPARGLQVGGLTAFSSADYPGHLAAVVFVQGCAWRCRYCHNPQLQPRRPALAPGPGWAEVCHWLQGRQGLLDAVVFSGGEPTLDPALPQAIADVKALGYGVGLHSAGMAPKRLAAVLPHIDWVGLDIKAPLQGGAGYHEITGARDARAAVRLSLQAVLDSGRPHECRTTAHPDLLDDGTLLAMGAELASAGVRHWALQIARRNGCAQPLEAVPVDYPAAATLGRLQGLFPGWVLRR